MSSLGTADLEFCQGIGEWAIAHRGTGVPVSTVAQITGVTGADDQRRALIDAVGFLWQERTGRKGLIDLGWFDEPGSAGDPPWDEPCLL